MHNHMNNRNGDAAPLVSDELHDVVMAVRERTGSELLTAYRGLGSRSPYLAITLAIFLFSLTGIPPRAGASVERLRTGR